MIANTLPSAGIHNGMDAGIFKPRSRPVTTALKSVIVFGLCMKWSYSHSASTAAPVDTIRTASARNPKLYTPAIAVGKSAMATSSMIFAVVILARTWGFDDTFSISSITFLPLYFFFLLARTSLRMDLMLCVSGRFAGQM